MGSYQELYERAKELAEHTEEKMDNDEAPLASVLKEKTHDLKEYMEGGGDADHARDRIKELTELLDQVADAGDQAPMNAGDADELKEQYQELREDLEDVGD